MHKAFQESTTYADQYFQRYLASDKKTSVRPFEYFETTLLSKDNLLIRRDI